jgi:hypothetical protein
VEEIVQRMLPLLIVFGVMFVVWLLLRSKASQLATTSDLDTKLGRGKPLVLDFFSNT